MVLQKLLDSLADHQPLRDQLAVAVGFRFLDPLGHVVTRVVAQGFDHVACDGHDLFAIAQTSPPARATWPGNGDCAPFYPSRRHRSGEKELFNTAPFPDARPGARPLSAARRHGTASARKARSRKCD